MSVYGLGSSSARDVVRTKYRAVQLRKETARALEGTCGVGAFFVYVKATVSCFQHAQGSSCLQLDKLPKSVTSSVVKDTCLIIRHRCQ